MVTKRFGVVVGVACLLLGTLLVHGGETNAPVVGQPWTVPDLGMELLPVAAGSFLMGANGGAIIERPVHEVRITKPYWLGKTEVTQAQWQAITGNNPSNFKGDNLPVEQVSWDDCVEFCRKLTERERTASRLPTGYVYRLPTEAEWEYAARGGDRSRNYTYSGSNDLDEVGWYGGNSGNATHPVGQKKANELALYDMSGNVWEWCHDWYDEYTSDSVTDPHGASSGSYRMLRGGSWGIDATGCRSAFRFSWSPLRSNFHRGFRVVLAQPIPTD